MLTIALQMILCLLLAALIGFVVGWLLRKLSCVAHETKSRAQLEVLRADKQKLQDELMRNKAALANSSKPVVSAEDAALRQELSSSKANLAALEQQGYEKARIIRQLSQQLSLQAHASSTTTPAQTLDNSAEIARLEARLQGAEIERRGSELRLQDALRMLQAKPLMAGAPHAGATSVEPPRQYKAAPSTVDNLEEIYGVGPVLSKMLNRLGIYTFKQVARWSEADIAFFDSQLEQFHGRIKRENWIASAREQHFKKYSEQL